MNSTQCPLIPSSDDMSGWYPDMAMVPIGRISTNVLIAGMVELSLTRVLNHLWANILLTMCKIFSEC